MINVWPYHGLTRGVYRIKAVKKGIQINKKNRKHRKETSNSKTHRVSL